MPPSSAGASAFITPLLAAVQERPLVAVLGPSGSGKSSLVFAGLLPAPAGRGRVAVASAGPATVRSTAWPPY